MIALVGGDLRLDIPETVNGRTFDDDRHGLSHCMSAVDWIVGLAEETYLVEAKDPDDPDARHHGARGEFVQDFLSGNLDKKLVAKFRDTFLYEWACDHVNKPILHVVIVASKALEPAQLLTRTDALNRGLPSGTPCTWEGPLSKGCIVMNIEEWNRTFSEFRLSRISEGA